MTGLSRASINQILNGTRKNPTIKSLEKIASALNISVEELRKQIRKGGVR
jgi:transcriptional regulator with XRE-family HTH domain